MLLFTFASRKTLSLILFTLIISVFCSTSVQAKAIVHARKLCATSEEKKALDTRVLQTELMVAALTCNEKESYKQFVQKFQGKLKNHGTALQSFFSRNYKSKATHQLNQFVTQLANAVADRSAHTRTSVFCAGAKNLFVESLQHDEVSLLAMTSQDRFTSQHGIPSCEAKTNMKVADKK